MNKRREYGEKEHVFTKIKGRTNKGATIQYPGGGQGYFRNK